MQCGCRAFATPVTSEVYTQRPPRCISEPRRWLAALESKRVGHGGDARLSQMVGLPVDTIRRGREELEAGLEGRPTECIRNPGAGRPPEKKDPQIIAALKELVEPVTGGGLRGVSDVGGVFTAGFAGVGVSLPGGGSGGDYS
jgi:hypothetical protein